MASERERRLEEALRELADVTARALSGNYDEEDTRDALNDARYALATRAPQQDAKPVEGDPWEITPEDRIALLDANNRRLEPGQPHPMEVFRDRLRARVQPRRVSREEHATLVDYFRDKLGYVKSEAEAIAGEVYPALGLQSEGESDHG